MRLGGFGRIADYDDIKTAGFDYAELDIPEIEELTEEEFDAFREKVERERVPVLTGARALPVAEPWFFTEQFSLEKYREYMVRACSRAGRLGIKKIILGNGKARWLLDESSIGLERNFIELLRLYAEIAGEQGIEMILEPLGPDYSNYINTLPEAERVVHEAGNPNLFIMADLRHLYRGGESFGDVIKCAKRIHHIHVDYPETFPARPFPRKDDGFDYSGFLSAVKQSGYDGTLTIEADRPNDWKEAHREAVKVLKEVL